jgi:transposase InsO family protein
MTEIISNFVKNCIVYQTNKIIKIKKCGELSQVGPAKLPYDIVSIDTAGGFSGYNSKKRYIHIAVDHFSSYLWTLSSKTQSAKDFVNLIKIVIQTNKPKMILADRYTGIKSNEFFNFLDKNYIKLMFITVNCP